MGSARTSAGVAKQHDGKMIDVTYSLCGREGDLRVNAALADDAEICLDGFISNLKSVAESEGIDVVIDHQV